MSKNFQIRTPDQLFKAMKDCLASKELQISNVFFNYDLDKDTFLNVAEVTNLLKESIPGIQQAELKSAIDFLNPYNIPQPIVSLYQLVILIRDDESLLQHQKAIPLKETFKDYTPSEELPLNVIFNTLPNNNSVPVQPQNPGNLVPSQNIVGDDQPNPQIAQINDYYALAHPNVPGVKKFVATFQQLQQQNSIFSDQDFPANDQSLGPSEAKNGYQWLRPRDFAGKESYSLFESDESTMVKSEDVRQGQLGDCYFLASLSAIAKKCPQVIESLFVTQRTNPYGIYCVYLNVNGMWQAVIVDDYFPCTKQGNPCYSQSVNKELWVMVIEKAWAKVFGSYQSIISGNPREVMKALTAGITWTFMTSDAKFEEEIEDGYRQKCVMVSGTFSKPELERQMEQMGFVTGHAYSVLKSYTDEEINNQVSDKMKLVKLRNPWGQKEWRYGGECGDWSDQSPLWTPELKKKYKVENRDDGVFYMGMKDFRKYFNDVEFLYFRETYNLSGVKANFQRHHGVYFQVDIPKKGEYYFTVNQEDERFFRNKGGNVKYSYSPVRMVMVAEEGNELMFGKQGIDREVWMGGELKNRRYWMYAKVEWNTYEEKEVFVSVYGCNRVQIKQVNKMPNLLSDCFKTQAAKSQKWKNYPSQEGISKCLELNAEIGFGYLCFQNKNPQKTLESTMKLQIQGLKLRKPDRGQEIIAKVGPGETKIVVIEIDSHGYSLSNQEQIRIT